MHSHCAGAGKLVKVGPGFQEENGEVCAAVELQGEKGIDRRNIYAGALAVIGLRCGRRGQGKALGLGKGKVGDYIGQHGFLRRLVQLLAIAFLGMFPGRCFLIQPRQGIGEAAFEILLRLSLPFEELQRQYAIVPHAGFDNHRIRGFFVDPGQYYCRICHNRRKYTNFLFIFVLMKIVFLDAISMGDVSLEEMASLGELVCYPSSTAEEARERVKDADVACLNKVIVDQAFLDAAPKLKLVCEAGTGINNIDVKLCEARGVAVRNVAAYSTDSVAQIAWMHILNLSGRAFHYQNFVQSGAYSKNPVHVDYAHPFTEIAGKTLGIVGMGAIGQKVASIGRSFGMEVIYYSTSGTGHCKDYPCVSLEELLERADVISIHAPYNERTAGLIGYDQLKQMKRSAILVNTGRGGIAVEADLARALDEGLIKGAALDVYVKEPLPLESPLMHLQHPERLLFSPHVAWSSVEARDRLAHGMAENIRKFFA